MFKTDDTDDALLQSDRDDELGGARFRPCPWMQFTFPPPRGNYFDGSRVRVYRVVH